MALDTYEDLQAELKKWLHRDDLDGQIPTFIALAETEINCALNITPMEVEATLYTAPDSRFVPYPADMDEPIALFDETTQPRSTVDFMLADQLQVNAALKRAPVHWAVDGVNIAFDCLTDQAYKLSLRYVQKVNLSSANQTNEILKRYPNAYLYGALAQGFLFTEDDANYSKWSAKFNQTLLRVKANANRSKSGAALRTDLPTSLIYRGRRS